MSLPTKHLFGLSDIKLIDKQKINPYAEEAQTIAKGLCKKAGIHLSNFDGYNSMSAFLYPDASLDRLVGLIVIMNFLYYVDEVYERHERQGSTDKSEDIYLREVFDNCVEIIISGKKINATHELYDASYMIHETVVPLTNLDWMRRFITVTLQHLKSTTYNLEDIIEGNEDPIEAYVGLRELDCGMRPTMHMIEFANDFYLPEHVRNHPYIRSVEEPTANVAGLMNDIISYEKEVIEFDSRFNLVALLEDYRNLQFDQAVHEAVVIVNENTDNFIKRETEVPDFGDDETNNLVARYVQGLRDQINATWQWQMSTDRYRSPNSPYPELRI